MFFTSMNERLKPVHKFLFISRSGKIAFLQFRFQVSDLEKLKFSNQTFFGTLQNHSLTVPSFSRSRAFLCHMMNPPFLIVDNLRINEKKRLDKLNLRFGCDDILTLSLGKFMVCGTWVDT